MITSRFCSHCGAANAFPNAHCYACQQPLEASIDIPHLETPVSTLQPASTLLNERYTVLTEIGAGGFGAVYRARDTQERNRIVAIKQINLKGLSPQEIIEATDAFNREAQILTTLSHPLLPRIFDRFSDPEHWYLVMNFIDGVTLDEYLQQHVARALPAKTGLPLADTLTIGLQLCDVLHYLHIQQPPVIFRDIKPGNIMRTASGRLYLIDFGIARHFKPGQAKDTVPFGSPGFAAPEQYGRAQTTPQADIYSLGALLYCLISGDDPADHPFQFPPLRPYGIDGIRELDALIQRMIAIDPVQRPADIAEVRADLQAIQHIHSQANTQHIWLPPQGQTPPDPRTFRQQHIFSTTSTKQAHPKTSRRSLITTALGIGAIALIGGIATTLGNSQPPYSFSQYQISQNNSFTEGTANPPQVPTTPFIFWSPDLSHSAIVNAGQIEIYIDKNQTLLLTIQSSHTDTLSTIQWSLDNKYIALVSSDNSISTWDTSSGRNILTLITNTMRPSVAVAWSPNGQYFAAGYADPNNSMLSVFSIFDANNGKQLFQQSFFAQVATSLAWTADSKYILVPAPRVSPSDFTSTWTIDVWNSQTYQKFGTIDSPDTTDLDAGLNTIPLIACAPSSDQMAFIYRDTLWIGQITDPHSIHQLASIGTTPNANTFLRLAWSPDEQYLALLMLGTLNIWDTSTGQSILIDPTDGDATSGNLAAFIWSKDSQSVTVVDNDNVFSYWPLN